MCAPLATKRFSLSSEFSPIWLSCTELHRIVCLAMCFVTWKYHYFGALELVWSGIVSSLILSPKPCRKACFLALFWGSQLFQAVICGKNSLDYRDCFWRGLGERHHLSLPKAATVFAFSIWLAGWPMTQCKWFWGERQLVAPRRQLLILQHAPIGCQQMCLTRELIPQPIENCLVYAYTNSLCTFLFVPRCRCLSLLPFDTACAICRESRKRSL